MVSFCFYNRNVKCAYWFVINSEPKKNNLKIGTDGNPFSLSHQLYFAKNIFANTQMLYCHVNMVTGYPAHQLSLNIKL